MKRKHLINVFPFLKLFKKLNVEERKVLTLFLNEQGLDAIYQSIHNGLYNPLVKNRKNLKKKLLAEKSILRYLASPKTNLLRKKKKLTQVGGSLSLILGAVLPLLANLLMPK